MRRVVICGFLGCTVLFHIDSQPSRFSEKRSKIKRVFWFSLQLLAEIFFILRIIQRQIITNLHRHPSKVPVTFCFLSDFN
jgi:hypothetical protein